MPAARNISWLRLIRKHQTFMRIVTSFLCLSIGAMSLCTFILYLQFSQATIREIGENSQSLLQERARSFSYMMSWSSSYVSKASLMPEIISYALAAESNEFQDYSAWLKLKEIKDNNPFIDSIYIVNGYTNKVIDIKTGTSELADFYDQDLMQHLEKLNGPEKQLFLLRKLDSVKDTISLSGQYLTFIVPYEANRSKSAFVVNLTTSSFQQFLTKSLPGSENEIMMINERSLIVTSSDKSQFLLPSPAYLPLDAQTRAGWLTDKRSGLLIVYSDLPSQETAGWKIIETLPLKKILLKVDSLRNFTFWFYALVLAATLVIVWAISRKIYSPIQSLVDDVNRNLQHPHYGDAGGPYNEFALLSDTFHYQNKQIHQLTDKWRQTANETKEIFIRDLLGKPPSAHPDALSGWFDKYGLHIPTHSLALIVLRIDRFDEFSSQYTPGAQRLMCYALANIVWETLNPHCGVEAVDMKSDHIVAVCEAKSDKIELFQERVKQCQYNAGKFLQLSLSAAISGYIEDTNALHEEYLRTLDATNKRFIFGPGLIFFGPGTLDAAAEDHPYSYPDDKERLILNEIKLGHERETLLAIGKFQLSMQAYSYSEIKLSLMRLMVSIIRTLKQMKLELDQTSLGSMTRIEQSLNRIESLEAFGAWLGEALRGVFQQLERQAVSTTNQQLVAQMQNLVREQLLDPNLSTKSVASALKLSVVYIRQLYKEETGQSFSDYTTGLRLEEVKRLLVETDVPIEEIVRRTGFAAVNSFYTIFKRNFGMTPIQYRKNAQDE